MEATLTSAKNLKGVITVPGDKSISHRSLILASLAHGRSRIANFSFSKDCLSTMNCLRSLGVEMEIDADKVIHLVGKGLEGFREPSDILDCGNSGTTMRMMLGVLARSHLFAVLSGDRFLNRRPMGRVVEPLKKMGAHIWGREGGTKAPLAVKGTRLRGCDHRIEIPSAQVKSALLLAGLQAKGETSVTEPFPSRDHTERMLEYLGADIQYGDSYSRISSARGLQAKDIQIPGDFSSAAYFLVAALVARSSEITIRDVGINKTRAGLVEVLERMGADVVVSDRRILNNEPVADVTCHWGALKGVEVGGEIIPRLIDEIPVLCVAASLAEGRTVIKDAGELHYKECDRIEAMATELAKMGAHIVPTPDGFIIEGVERLRGARVDSRFDHRVAMSLAIAALAAEGETTISNFECVDISFPGFLDVLRSLME
ncbi:3-phosphoshikimate 1-carboxyvinyltransferase [Candidatus Hakubella thermalkaliphila]|uniref:3-phosphoshikimate 1-carboxyvinyltransferase n=2 Tax=Candidatus Hakubella thermalkaliphila TaxID=2754717 RepID=A0A6V8NN60_9ACTN|nr:3-phosphoshikimate 1-carboxyvinyltransferase [Candidatus Hakubella thermalkaliphila]GFP21553.1 3-phosphoshikimate 1-carboxyvinyltransferase [Candidatus Hakubella thermalkaliphila]